MIADHKGIMPEIAADIIPVLAGQGRARRAVREVATAIEQYGDDGRRPVAGVLIDLDSVAAKRPRRAGAQGRRGSQARADPRFDPERPGPFRAARDRRRRELGFEIFQRGDIETARVQTLLVAAALLRQADRPLRPGTLVITAADRSDEILATALIAQRGMPLAGFVLPAADHPAPEVMRFSPAAARTGCRCWGRRTTRWSRRPFRQSLETHRKSDPNGMDRVVSFLAERIDTRPLAKRIGQPAGRC